VIDGGGYAYVAVGGMLTGPSAALVVDPPSATNQAAMAVTDQPHA
jgi:hypothetical protein